MFCLRKLDFLVQHRTETKKEKINQGKHAWNSYIPWGETAWDGGGSQTWVTPALAISST